MISCVNCRQENILTLCKDNREIMAYCTFTVKGQTGYFDCTVEFFSDSPRREMQIVY
jgi:hypothetical protein